VRLEGLCQFKKSNDPIGNACSIVLQPTTLPRTLQIVVVVVLIIIILLQLGVPSVAVNLDLAVELNTDTDKAISLYINGIIQDNTHTM
jgi:hypothetical protein